MQLRDSHYPRNYVRMSLVCIAVCKVFKVMLMTQPLTVHITPTCCHTQNLCSYILINHMDIIICTIVPVHINLVSPVILRSILPPGVGIP